jgi:hypothetical protein
MKGNWSGAQRPPFRGRSSARWQTVRTANDYTNNRVADFSVEEFVVLRACAAAKVP